VNGCAKNGWRCLGTHAHGAEPNRARGRRVADSARSLQASDSTIESEVILVRKKGGKGKGGKKGC